MVWGSRANKYLLLDKYLAILYVLVTYISWQLHELGHWVACKVLGINAIFGFNVWKIVSSHGSSTLAITAGPLTNLILAVIGLVLMRRTGSLLVARLGLFLLISNSFMDIGAALASIKHVIVYHDWSSEPTWKFALTPVFLVLMYVGVKVYREKLRLRTLLIMAALTAALGIIAIPMDIVTWSCIEHKMSICSPVAGISAIVVVVNVVVAVMTIAYIVAYREQLGAIKLQQA